VPDGACRSGYSSESARELLDSRWNATKHGCTSSRLLLPDENPAELEELLEGLREQYRPETTLDLKFVVEAARAMWVLERNNRRYDEIEQTLYAEERDSTKWPDEQWKRLDLRARYRTTAERSCARALRNLAHVRSQRAGTGEREVMPKEEKKKAEAEKPLQLPSGGPPPLYQRVVVTVADGKASTRVYPTNEQLRRVTENRAPETNLARIYEFLNGVPSEYGWAEGARSSWQMDVEAWRKLIAMEEARGDGMFLCPDVVGEG
jgi:hypothetical protein